VQHKIVHKAAPERNERESGGFVMKLVNETDTCVLGFNNVHLCCMLYIYISTYSFANYHITVLK